jgi:DNA-binding transcriptional ArsR family regulator
LYASQGQTLLSVALRNAFSALQGCRYCSCRQSFIKPPQRGNSNRISLKRKKDLRNRLVARMFATERFLNRNSKIMRRDIFQAIADPTRRAILTLIAVQAMTPNAIADNFNTTRQAISKHLRILSECELVKQEQQGREIYYSLEIEKMKEIDKWLTQFRKIWETRFSQLDKVLSTIKKQKK